MSQSTQQHRQAAPRTVRCAVVTVSDTRTLENDRGGQLLEECLTAAGHTVVRREIVPDDPTRIRALIGELVSVGGWGRASSEPPGDLNAGGSAEPRPQPPVDAAQLDAILITGGTGIAERDQTYETVSQLLTKTLPGYGELFRMLSYADVGPAAMLSRTVGGVIGQVVVLTMPGSPAAVRLALDKLILPELAHVVYEARK